MVGQLGKLSKRCLWYFEPEDCHGLTWIFAACPLVAVLGINYGGVTPRQTPLQYRPQCSAGVESGQLAGHLVTLSGLCLLLGGPTCLSVTPDSG